MRTGTLDPLAGGVFQSRKEDLYWADFDKRTVPSIHMGKGKNKKHLLAVRPAMSAEQTLISILHEGGHHAGIATDTADPNFDREHRWLEEMARGCVRPNEAREDSIMCGPEGCDKGGGGRIPGGPMGPRVRITHVHGYCLFEPVIVCEELKNGGLDNCYRGWILEGCWTNDGHRLR